jgi:hypothetical protein
MAMTGALLVLGLLEVALRILPGPSATRTGYYFDPLVLTYPAHHEWWAASGWDLRNARRLKSNNFGFPTARNFDRDETAIALIGDSFVEASALKEADGPGDQLERRLNGRAVFAMGVPGSNLLDYAERVRFAVERFGTRDFVLVLERGDVRQSVCGDPNVTAVCLDPETYQVRIEKQEPPTFVKSVLRESRAAQYLLGQLRLDPRRFFSSVLTSMRTPDEGTPLGTKDARRAQHGAHSYVDPVFHHFVERISSKVKGRIILVLDADRLALTGSANGGGVPTDPERQRFLELATRSGIEFIDLEPVFAAHIARSRVKLEVSPTDSHWNPLAVSLVTKAIADALNESGRSRVPREEAGN